MKRSEPADPPSDQTDGCYWIRTDEGLLLIPGCYSAIQGGPAECVCPHDEAHLRIRVADAHRVLTRIRGEVPGLREALALVEVEAAGTMALSSLLNRIRATPATPGHGAHDQRWLIGLLQEKAVEPKTTMAQMARRRLRGVVRG